ncbi:MAG: hypothetical protein ACFHX7_04125 [Pseudomonadota bacterium]
MFDNLPQNPVIDQFGERSGLALEGLDDADLLPAVANLPGFHSAIDGQSNVSRETRAAMRDLTRDLREVEREISEHRIQMIQAEDDSEKTELQSLLTGLEKQRGDYQARLSGLESTLEAEKAKLAAKRAEMREKASLSRRQQMDALESTVMQYLCDYGGTLRNLPDKEHVSIIFKQLTTEGQAQIYVFARDDVLDCRTDGKRLKERATAYLF